MLQACLNGGISRKDQPRVPISPEELARDAVAVRNAGADELHIHPRDEQSAETLAALDVGQAISAIRAAVPGMPVGVSTGAWIKPGGRMRHRHIADWEILPDYASVNLNELDAIEAVDLLHGKGVGVEAGLWDSHDAERFVKEVDAVRCLRVLVEMTSNDPAVALLEAGRIMQILAKANCALPILLHGEGGSVWACIEEAARLGLSTRVGFEDGRHLPDGSEAESNAALVKAAAHYVKPNQ